jgi:hypothetical protein
MSAEFFDAVRDSASPESTLAHIYLPMSGKPDIGAPSRKDVEGSEQRHYCFFSPPPSTRVHNPTSSLTNWSK